MTLKKDGDKYRSIISGDELITLYNGRFDFMKEKKTPTNFCKFTFQKL